MIYVNQVGIKTILIDRYNKISLFGSWLLDYHFFVWRGYNWYPER